jgi:hypothetical protein
MKLTSPDYSHGEPMPQRFTCEGEDVSPAFAWSDAPAATQSFALIMHDPDAPRAGGFTHWLLYDISASVSRLPQKVAPQASLPDLGMQGKNDFGRTGYMGPCPPSGRHRYFMRLYALRTKLDLGPGATYSDVTAAPEGKVLAQAELMGTYEKKGTKVA